MEKESLRILPDWPELTRAEARHFANLRYAVFFLSFLGFLALISTRLVTDYWLPRTVLGHLAGLSLLSASLVVVVRVHEGPRLASWAMVAASALGLMSEILRLAAGLVPAYGATLEKYSSLALVICMSGWVCFMNPALFEMAVGRIRLSRETQKLVEANKTRRQSEKRYIALFENASEVIGVIDPRSGDMLECNQRTCDFFGCSRGELFKAGLVPLFGAACGEITEGMARVLKGGTVRIYDLEIPLKGGKTARIDVSMSPLPDDEVLLLVRDMTQRKEVEERLQRIQNFESIGRLAGGVAHDFNNVLTPILGFAELLLEDAPPGTPGIRNSRRSRRPPSMPSTSRSNCSPWAAARH